MLEKLLNFSIYVCAGNDQSESSIKMQKLPEELVVLVLSYVDTKSQVFSCRLVCKNWKAIVENESLRNYAAFTCVIAKSYPKLPWYCYYAACASKVFQRNLLVNPCGKEQFNGWQTILQGGHRWIVECPPQGCSQVIPEEAFISAGITDSIIISCFATSFGPCEKEQIISLKAQHITSKLMDEIQPNIEVSEWYAPRFDCASKYILKVTLLDHLRKPIGNTFKFSDEMEQWTEGSWRQAKHTFQDYGPGVCYIKFNHCGHDSQFWAGHYGAKVTLGLIKLELPSIKSSAKSK